MSSYLARNFSLRGLGVIDDVNATYYALDYLNSKVHITSNFRERITEEIFLFFFFLKDLKKII